MTAAEFKRAYALADTPDGVSYTEQDISIFFGYGDRDFTPVVVTLKQYAALMKYQCMNMGHPVGRPDLRWDMEALNEFKEMTRRKVTLLD